MLKIMQGSNLTTMITTVHNTVVDRVQTVGHQRLGCELLS